MDAAVTALAPLLALLAAAGPAPLHARADGYEEELAEADELEPGPRLHVAGWGGSLYDVKARDGIPFGGGQVSWAVDAFDVGVLVQAYKFGRERAGAAWRPVVLARVEERFETGRGLEATAAFGAGAGRERSWTAWFQLALGMRVRRGPLFAGVELGFEQDRFLRLGANLGVAAF
jgi:hypothetical protein